VKIWFQNRRTKWKKHENITANDVTEGRLQTEKNPDVAKAIQNAAKLKKAKERLEAAASASASVRKPAQLSTASENGVDGLAVSDVNGILNQPLDFSMVNMCVNGNRTKERRASSESDDTGRSDCDVRNDENDVANFTYRIDDSLSETEPASKDDSVENNTDDKGFLQKNDNPEANNDVLNEDDFEEDIHYDKSPNSIKKNLSDDE